MPGYALPKEGKQDLRLLRTLQLRSVWRLDCVRYARAEGVNGMPEHSMRLHRLVRRLILLRFHRLVQMRAHPLPDQGNQDLRLCRHLQLRSTGKLDRVPAAAKRERVLHVEFWRRSGHSWLPISGLSARRSVRDAAGGNMACLQHTSP